jgi:predicted glycoside hydrolase/deacetylase ChbG (UPF0249 family)
MEGYILTADDYGLAEGFNRGILELANTGYLSGISVMVKRKFVRPSDLLTLPHIDLGLHLELVTPASEKDIQKQIEIFQKLFERMPDYLDGHQHCHIAQENIEAVILIAQKYRLPVRSRFSEDRERLRAAGIATPDAFISWHPTRKEIFFENVRQARGMTEIVCHPGYFDAQTDYPYNREREAELEILKSQEFQDLLRHRPRFRYSTLSR